MSIFSKQGISGRLSLWAWFIIAGFYVFNFAKTREWQRPDALRFDMASYYSYLPATFVQQDITLSFDVDPNGFYSWSIPAPNGGRVIKMTMGVALLELPFFLAAHTSSIMAGYPATGYTEIYVFFILLGSLFYTMVGFWLLRKLLKLYFGETSVALTILFVASGTNLFYYTLYEGPMSHAYNFFLITALLWFTVRWYTVPKTSISIITGVLCGLIILIRPLNVLVLLLPLLYGVYSKETLQNKWTLLQKKAGQLLIIVLATMAVGSLQLMYWKYMTGNFLFYTYGDEGFFFSHPHIVDGLFSFRKGWLLYTPVMAFAVAGIFFLFRYAKNWALPIIVFFPVFIWAVFSWWTWWYGGSFSSRPMIDIYGIMALPMAAFITFARKKIWAFATLLPIGAFFVYLNWFQTQQYRSTQLHWDSMTNEAYTKIFLTKNWPQNYDKLIKAPDYEKAKRGEDE